MASPAFIYAFDTLGPERFVQLCALLLSARYRGFLLGGVGPDDGADATIDPDLAIWTSDDPDAIRTQLVPAGQTVVFQFKHKVVGRVGEAAAREQLLRLYRGPDSELRRPFVNRISPWMYVLVTNVEVTSHFRESFLRACVEAGTSIQRFQVIGLDELENWVTLDRDLRALYFPTLFTIPRFDLRVVVTEGEHIEVPGGRRTELFQVKMSNIGAATSYVASVIMRFVGNDQLYNVHILNPLGEGIRPIAPGRSEIYSMSYASFAQLESERHDLFPTHVQVLDEVDNVYEATIPAELRQKVVLHMKKSKR